MASKKSNLAGMDYATGPSKEEQDRWQAEDDLRTLIRAEEIKKDKKRLANARKAAKEQLAAATATAQAV